MLGDLRYAVRALARSPGFAAIAVITLALGIGVNTAVFSLLQGIVLKPLPIADASRVVQVENNQYTQMSMPDYLDLARQNAVFSAVAAYQPTAMAVDTGTGAQQAWGYLVTGGYFDLLGVTPALGRFFTSDVDGRRNAVPVAVLSYDSWQRRFGGRSDIAGTTVRINGLPYTILGVLPRDYHGTEMFLRMEIWVPMSMQSQIEGSSWLDSRNSFNALVVGRLKPGLSVSQAASGLAPVARAIASAYPRTHEGLRFSLTRPGLLGGRTPATAFLGVVLALAGIVLLASCVNLATLMTSRLVDRTREIAIRLAIGASRTAVARHVLAETLLVSGLGGALGVLLAAGALRALSEWRLPLPIPIQFSVDPDMTVFAFSTAVIVVVAVVATLAPSRRIWQTDLTGATRASLASVPARRWTLRDVLLAAQVTLCCLLVMCAFVAVRGLTRARSTSLGLQPQGLAAVGFDLGTAGYDARTGTAFKDRVLGQIAAIRGVTAVAMANALPLTPDQNNDTVYPDDGSELRPANAGEAAVYQVSPGYFEVAGTRLLAGRDIQTTDRITTPRVAVVNTAFARRVMRTKEPVGKRFRDGPGGGLVEVVGLVETGKYYSLNEEPRPVVFFPMRQRYNSSSMIVARVSGSPAQTAVTIGREVQSLDARLPLSVQGPVSDAITLAFLPSQVAVTALGIFGVLAIAIAVVGVYGLAAYAVSARLRDLGIRLAVGASRWQALRSVLGRAATLLAWGSLAGIAVGTAAQGPLDAVVYDASTRDPVVPVTVAATMMVIGLLATWIPARRVLHLDPARTLRAE